MIAQKPYVMLTTLVAARKPYMPIRLVRMLPIPAFISQGTMHIKASRLRKKTISSGCNSLEAWRIRIDMQLKNTVATVAKMAARRILFMTVLAGPPWLPGD